MSAVKPIRVVLADDHEVVRAGIRRFLESAGDIEVVAEANDGAAAIEAIHTHAPDVAVLDIRMPQVSGIEVIRRIRGENLDTGLLVLSAFDDDPYVMAVLQAGANGYVLKNASAEDIVRAVRAVHHGKSALDPEIARKVMDHVSGRSPSIPADKLTDRELEVLALAAKGWTNKEIAYRLKISDRTVQGHLANIFSKLQAASRTEAVMRALSLGYLPADIGPPEGP